MAPADPGRYRRDPDVDRVVQEPVELPADAWSGEDDGTRRYVGAIVRDGCATVFVRNGWSDGWVVPGGRVEPGESHEEAALREVREETGVEATIERPLCVAEQTFRSPDGDRSRSATFVLFEAEALDPTIDPAPDASETIEDVGWFGEPPSPLDPDHAPVFERYL